MNKLIIIGEVYFETNQTDINKAVDELFYEVSNLSIQGINLDINITDDMYLVDENGNEIDEE